MMTYAQDPVMLHEFLHVYHARLMPQGYDNRGILAFYAEGKSKNFYPKEAYVLKNNREFFAVTASIFLAGKHATHEPNTRGQRKRSSPTTTNISSACSDLIRSRRPSLRSPPRTDSALAEQALHSRGGSPRSEPAIVSNNAWKSRPFLISSGFAKHPGERVLR
jgi:hypothetical protein